MPSVATADPKSQPSWNLLHRSTNASQRGSGGLGAPLLDHDAEYMDSAAGGSSHGLAVVDSMAAGSGDHHGLGEARDTEDTEAMVDAFGALGLGPRVLQLHGHRLTSICLCGWAFLLPGALTFVLLLVRALFLTVCLSNCLTD